MCSAGIYYINYLWYSLQLRTGIWFSGRVILGLVTKYCPEAINSRRDNIKLHQFLPVDEPSELGHQLPWIQLENLG